MDLQCAVFLATELMEKHGLYARGWHFEYNNAVRSFGICCYRKKTIYLSRPLTERCANKDVEDTILHEIAHAEVGPGHHHDIVWRSRALAIGCNGKTCNNYGVSVPKPWRGICDTPRCIHYNKVVKRLYRRNPKAFCYRCLYGLKWERAEINSTEVAA